eukprot:gene40853-50247_t
MTTLSPYNPYNSDTFEYPIYPLLEGTKMHLSSVAVGGKYVRVDPTSSSQQMALSENIPWKHGSTFEVFKYDASCFQLRSMRNMWLRVDYDRGEVLADGIMQLQGTFFSAVRVATPQQHAANSSGLVGDENEGDLVRLK